MAVAFLLCQRWQRRPGHQQQPQPQPASQQPASVKAAGPGSDDIPAEQRQEGPPPQQPQPQQQPAVPPAALPAAGAATGRAVRLCSSPVPTTLSPFAAMTLQRVPLAGASPFAASAAERWQSDEQPAGPAGPAAAPAGADSTSNAAGSRSSRLERRNSPPHLSTLPGALPFLRSPLPSAPRVETPGAASPAAGALGSPALSGHLGAPAAAWPQPQGADASRPSSLDELRADLGSTSGHAPDLERLLAGKEGSDGGSIRLGSIHGPEASAGGGQEPCQGPHRSSIDVPHQRPSRTDGSRVLSDWEVSPCELEICKRPDGSLWQLGSGGFGRVYKALRFGCTPVAVKVLAPTSEAYHTKAYEFEQEIELLRACKDPNIVAFLGASLSADFTMLVTEYCEGGSLAANLAAGRISWYRRGKQVALDVARGVVYLHARGILHMDLKSANILLDRHGNAKIADLGLAKIVQQERSSVSANLGTLQWAAPEMLLGQRCTTAADIYSFGVCLWEICTGQVPQRGRMRPLAAPADCPPEVAALVEQCMSPDPSQRPTAPQLVERLMAAPASPSAGSPRQQGQPPGSRLARSEAGAGGPAVRPPRPRSEASLASLQAPRPLAPPPAVQEEAPHTTPAAGSALAAAVAEAEAVRQPSVPLSPLPAHQPTSPLPGSPMLATARSVVSDSGAMTVSVSAGVVAAAAAARVASMPAPRTSSNDSHVDVYGLGLF